MRSGAVCFLFAPSELSHRLVCKSLSMAGIFLSKIEICHHQAGDFRGEDVDDTKNRQRKYVELAASSYV
jgi:hypothetical protein